VIGQDVVEAEEGKSTLADAILFAARRNILSSAIPCRRRRGSAPARCPAGVQQVAGGDARSEAKRGRFSSYPQDARSAKLGRPQQLRANFKGLAAPAGAAPEPAGVLGWSRGF